MDIVARATVMFFIMFILLRLLGKRELSQVTPFELVLLIVMGDLIQQGVTHNDFSLTGATLAIGTIAFWALAFSWITYLSPRAERMLEGVPRVLIQHGRLIEANMRRDRITRAELEIEMRLAGIRHMADVEWGILEPNGKISFIAKDDYGLQEAHAEIVPVEAQKDARPLYPLPEYRLDLPRRSARDAKGTTSRNLSEHPLSGKRVKITLVAKDAAGQEGRSQPVEMVLPAKNFFEPLAAAVAEQRQVFALDANQLPYAIALNEALTIRPEETIPNLTHYLLLQSAAARMKLSRTEDQMRETADYLWEIALGIEDGNLSLADRRLREAQKALSEALERNAPDEEIAALMKELREAMDAYMQELARQAAKNGQMQQNAQQQGQVLRQQDLQRMMDQIENLVRSGARDQAQQMLSELQRMMNNLQAGRPQQGQQGQQNDAMRQQMDKLGELMQKQQQLMEQTFQLDQALRDRQQRGDPMPGEEGEQQQQQQGDNSAGQQPTDQMTAEQLREALKKLQEQQDALGKQLGEVQDALKGMGMEPGEGFGQAGREMKGASEALGEGQGESAVGSQGRALEALRQGAQNMMSQMQAMGQGQGQGPGEGMPQAGRNGRDPLGRERPVNGQGPDFGGPTKIPEEIDIQRAREILDEIRRRLGTGAAPGFERDYLERLLGIR